MPNQYETETTHENAQNTILLQCDDCGNEVREDDLTGTDDGNEVCEDCYDNNYSECYGCSGVMVHDDMHYYNGDYYCEDCFYDNCFHCASCGEPEHLDYSRYDDHSGDTYCEGCYEEYGGEEYDWNVFSNEYVQVNDDFASPTKNLYKSDTYDLIPSRRYQGIEVEANHNGDYSRDNIARAIAERIDDTRLEQMFDEVSQAEFPDWYKISGIQVVSDGSITGGDDGYGYEYVMTPRRGDQLYTDMCLLTDTLVDYGHYISRKCGYHLHIDIRDYDYYHLTCLMAMVKLIEPHIYSWVPQSRLTGNWCRPISQNWYDFNGIYDRDDFIEIYYDNGNKFRYEKYHDKRYHGFNLHSHFGSNQGLELRYHGGTLNPTKMLHWSILWGQIVDKCYELGNELKTQVDRRNFFKDITFDKRYGDETKGFRNPTMDIQNLFETFDIPQTTKDYYGMRQKEIENNPNTSPTHFVDCFSKTSHIVEFDKATMSFNTVKKLPHRVGRYGTLQELTYDDISSHFEIAS